MDNLSHQLSDERAADHCHTDFVCLAQDLTVEEAIARLRTRNDEGKIVYYYVVDGDGALVGVLPVRMLVLKAPNTRVGDACIRDIVYVDADTPLFDVAATFEKYRYLSLPVLDDRRRIVGVIDLRAFTRHELDVTNKPLLDEVFQTIGLRINTVLNAGVARGFILRFPWLLSTLAGGLLCAVMSGVFESTLAANIALTLFLPLILALGESVSVQSMTIVLQLLAVGNFSPKEAATRLFKEVRVGVLLGFACSLVVAAVAVLWRGPGSVVAVLAVGVPGAVLAACVVGSVVPVVLFRLKMNVRVAAGPIALAIADVCTISIYLVAAGALAA